MGSQMANLRPAVTLLHTEFVADRADDFATGGATTAGGAWKANARSTVLAKGHGRPLLGNPKGGHHLRQSVVDKKHADHVFIWVEGTGAIEIGTKHWKARIHQHGLGPGGVRKMIDPRTAQREQYAGIFTTWILEGILRR